MVTPVKPDELKLRPTEIPSEVIAAVNSLLAEKFRGERNFPIKILQEEVCNRALENFGLTEKNVTKEDIYKNDWLDFEYVFQEAGWTVRYDSPAYCENYKAYFTFTPSRKRV